MSNGIRKNVYVKVSSSLRCVCILLRVRKTLELNGMTAGFRRCIIIISCMRALSRSQNCIPDPVSGARIYQRCDVSTVQIKWG